ncbi:hypothetical protein ACOME3_010444 [Neoechinorhynchus agilis]
MISVYSSNLKCDVTKANPMPRMRSNPPLKRVAERSQSSARQLQTTISYVEQSESMQMEQNVPPVDDTQEVVRRKRGRPRKIDKSNNKSSDDKEESNLVVDDWMKTAVCKYRPSIEPFKKRLN